ncbi:hypothetical protein OG883_36410 [Streptomyces sp. NBC_01142]|uniref:hypothetical protein n=1 Tax=Streptomyces sp. NBC_01142 TaxID=2975865 RepID=UPI00225A5D43|nr:hypothetical protein [Streptomyces sp. NBC_01142]MCX4825249.1 hypothetical protein [Streptomyces sp. NBC_01142]
MAAPEVGEVTPRTRIADEARDDSAFDSGPRDASQQEPGTDPLLGQQEAEELRSRWQEIQQRFVDDPQDSVRAADELVAEVMQLLAATFTDHKQGLESQWHRGEEAATEDLRLALRQYRSFFVRLLST